MKHIPVMLDEIINILEPNCNSTYIDATFGRGGYSSALLKKGAKVLAIDRDIVAVQYAREEFQNNNNFRIVYNRFANLDKIISDNTDFLEKIDGIVFDLGLCTDQFLYKGFSFHSNESIDMDMGLSKHKTNYLLNQMHPNQLQEILFKYGEDRNTKKITHLISKNRPIHSSKQLSELISKNIASYNGKHSATKTFQAIRIYVNDELNEIKNALIQARGIDKIAVVSFHSLEDRIVKHFFHSEPVYISPKLLQDKNNFSIIKAEQIYQSELILPSEEEIIKNHSSRSAKLRYGIKYV